MSLDVPTQWRSPVFVRARVRSALADAVLHHFASPPHNFLTLQHFPPDHLLPFFGGRSLGIPGPGGAGSVLVRVQATNMPPGSSELRACPLGRRQRRIMWLDTTASSTDCSRRKTAALLVCMMLGSAMVIAKFRPSRSPRQPHHAALYRKARGLADDVAVASWSHHYREYNTIVNRAANVSMDTKKSLQVHASTDRTIAQTLHRYVHHDVNPWVETPISVEVRQNSCRSQTARGRTSADHPITA